VNANLKHSLDPLLRVLGHNAASERAARHPPLAAITVMLWNRQTHKSTVPQFGEEFAKIIGY
jgi:hypothetical protein